MPTPRLLHKVPVTIELIDKAETAYNVNAGEPIRTAERTPTVTLPGQIHWGTEDKPDFEKAGVVENSDGWVTMRTKDLNAQSLIDEKGNPGILRGSKFIKFGKQDGLELFVVQSKPLGHWPDKNGMTLVRVYFQDRKG